jgi:hypothetical protein
MSDILRGAMALFASVSLVARAALPPREWPHRLKHGADSPREISTTTAALGALIAQPVAEKGGSAPFDAIVWGLCASFLTNAG